MEYAITIEAKETTANRNNGRVYLPRRYTSFDEAFEALIGLERAIGNDFEITIKIKETDC